ncbi:uncharacterized protein I206_102584 [Kwoniella pini CBS 10737]|uniref:Uncharacterized protein n=1 Tax=Kwoniella pini CBS 10737 TaxID=1296096 RepID=A0A1B9I5S8_9TREE|nr:uncharacterized protein I206_02936 [Kwoniella pini CBS 10737]OCF50878.1 hypothetical protein I206_02936 [Kwoniella pini CBS 10737]
MIAQDVNGICVTLTVDGGRKLDERLVNKTVKNGRIRMECFVCPEPYQEFTINVRLGHQKPWENDWIAEPLIKGFKMLSLHLKKRNHINQEMSTGFERNYGVLTECNLSFGRIVDPIGYDKEEGEVSRDKSRGTIVVGIRRGYICKMKPELRQIHEVIDGPKGRNKITSGAGRVVGEKAAYDQEWSTFPEDRVDDFLTFVFKVRTPQYLQMKHLVERVPAQQHPCQVSRSVRIKAERGARLESGHSVAPSALSVRDRKSISIKAEPQLVKMESSDESDDGEIQSIRPRTSTESRLDEVMRKTRAELTHVKAEIKGHSNRVTRRYSSTSTIDSSDSE